MMRWCIAVLAGIGLAAQAADEPRPARKGGSRQPVQASACNDVPAHPFDLILGRPTATAVTVSVLCYEDAEGFVAYGTEPGKLAARTPLRSFRKGEPAEVVLSALQPDTGYSYQLRLARATSGEYSFHTARPPGGSFTFTVTADSHLDENTDPALYQRTLANALADALFVVLDPFWFTPKQRGPGDNWKRTLGAEQYQWLKRTLAASRAKFKFVFIHHLVGGAGRPRRRPSTATCTGRFWVAPAICGSPSVRSRRRWTTSARTAPSHTPMPWHPQTDAVPAPRPTHEAPMDCRGSAGASLRRDPGSLTLSHG